MARLVLLSLMIAGALACSRSTTSPAGPTASTGMAAPPAPAATAPLPEITSSSEEGFHDLVFALIEREKLASGAERIRARGRHRGAIVQFDVELGDLWKGSNAGPIQVFSGYVTVKSIGEDASLVRALDAEYGTKLAPKGMKPATKLAAIVLEGDPRSLDGGVVKIKLFNESEDETKYAEMFLNIGVAKRVVELREKDEEYRAAVVRAFAR